MGKLNKIIFSFKTSSRLLKLALCVCVCLDQTGIFSRATQEVTDSESIIFRKNTFIPFRSGRFGINQTKTDKKIRPPNLLKVSTRFVILEVKGHDLSTIHYYYICKDDLNPFPVQSLMHMQFELIEKR